MSEPFSRHINRHIVFDHLLPTQNNAFDLGSSSLAFRDAYFDRTVRLNNNNDVSIRWLSTTEQSASTDYTMTVGGGGTLGFNRDGAFSIEFEPKESGVGDGSAHILEINFQHVNTTAAPLDSNRLTIRNVIDSDAGNIYGDAEFNIGSSGIVNAVTGISYTTTLSGTGPIGTVFDTNFINEAGGIKFYTDPVPFNLTTMRVAGSSAATFRVSICFGNETQTASDSYFQFQNPAGMSFRNAATQSSIFRINGSTSFDPGTGTSDIVSMCRIDAPVTTTNTPAFLTTLYIPSGPTTGTTNYAAWIDAGIVRCDDDVFGYEARSLLRYHYVLG